MARVDGGMLAARALRDEGVTHLFALGGGHIDPTWAAAPKVGIRRNTARSQLQSIFMKTNAKRQSELVRMILSSVATLSH